MEKSDWLAVVFGIIFLGAGALMSTLGQRVLRFAGVAVIVVGVCGLVSWFSYFRDLAPSCYNRDAADSETRSLSDAFNNEILNHASTLGPPIDCLKMIRDSSRGDFEWATEIWTSDPRKMIFLFRRSKEWEDYPEPGPCQSAWCSLDNISARLSFWMHIQIFSEE